MLKDSGKLILLSDDEFRYLRSPGNCEVAAFSVTAESVLIDEPLPVIDFQI